MDFQLTITQNIVLFLFSAVLIWLFCNKLSTIVDFIDDEFHLGAAFGGTIMLAIVTNLPEIAIAINGAVKGTIDVAVGNVLGGIAIQSALLILFDFASRKHDKKPLSTLTSSETGLLQGLFLVGILCMVMVGKQFPENFIFSRTTPPELLIVALWIASILAMKKFQKFNPKTPIVEVKKTTKLNKKSAVIGLLFISMIVLIFGVVLENTSSAIASYYKIDGVIFGATVLALVTSLPEISGGLAFVKNKSYTPIIDDIFGGNAFLPTLFLPMIWITNSAILPKTQSVNLYLTAVAMLITLIYIIGMVIKSRKRYFGMGVDSWVALLIYSLSVIGLFFIA
jgi:cation:H+ antiporter